MRYLLDTQLLLWAALDLELLSPKFLQLANGHPPASLFFSAASLWETTIKFSRGKPDFTVDPVPLRAGLLTAGYVELAITSEHAMYVAKLPHIHEDPFDRLLIAQATVEDLTLLTSDKTIALYPGPIIHV